MGDRYYITGVQLGLLKELPAADRLLLICKIYDNQFMGNKHMHWKEGTNTYMVEKREYPHDEQCEGSMCWCAKRAERRDAK